MRKCLPCFFLLFHLLDFWFLVATSTLPTLPQEGWIIDFVVVVHSESKWRLRYYFIYKSMQGFFFQFCDVAQVAIILKVIWPKLATCTNTEVGKKSIFFYIFRYLLELIIKIWRLVELFFRSLANWGPFFSWKILHIGRNHIFQVRTWQKFASKRNAESMQPCDWVHKL